MPLGQQETCKSNGHLGWAWTRWLLRRSAVGNLTPRRKTANPYQSCSTLKLISISTRGQHLYRSTILYRIETYRGANDHANTDRTEAQARPSAGCRARRKCPQDSEGTAAESRKSSRTRRGHHETGNGAQHLGDKDWRLVVAAGTCRTFGLLQFPVTTLGACLGSQFHVQQFETQQPNTNSTHARSARTAARGVRPRRRQPDPR